MEDRVLLDSLDCLVNRVCLVYRVRRAATVQ